MSNDRKVKWAEAKVIWLHQEETSWVMSVWIRLGNFFSILLLLLLIFGLTYEPTSVWFLVLFFLTFVAPVCCLSWYDYVNITPSVRCWKWSKQWNPHSAWTDFLHTLQETKSLPRQTVITEWKSWYKTNNHAHCPNESFHCFRHLEYYVFFKQQLVRFLDTHVLVCWHTSTFSVLYSVIYDFLWQNIVFIMH